MLRQLSAPSLAADPSATHVCSAAPFCLPTHASPRLPQSLLADYLQTCYELRLPGDNTSFRIGPITPAVRRWLARRGRDELVFVTAWNPHSRPLGHWVNLRRNRELARLLQRSGQAWVPGLGRPLQGDWIGEESLAVLGMSLRSGAVLGRHFSQNAIVHLSLRYGARLVLL